jgi:hypothetical protein
MEMGCCLLKQDNITEMHIYVKYEIVSFMRRQFSSLKVEKKKQKKQKNKSRDLHKNCVILMMAYAINSNVRNLGLVFIYDKVGHVFQNEKERYG